MTRKQLFPRIAGFLAAASTVAATSLLLACHSGTPAAPEGSEIATGCEFISRNPTTGDFEAILNATVMDATSNVPQVGVGVFFRVASGNGQVQFEGPIRTDDDGHAESVLVATGATAANPVSVQVSSGPAEATLQLSVTGCSGRSADPPRAALTLNPTSGHRAGQAITSNVGTSTDADCPSGKPDTWRVDWGDSTPPDEGSFTGTDTEATHTYAASLAGTSVTITVTVTDCTGLTATTTRTISLA
jgi:hypothetical protein